MAAAAVRCHCLSHLTPSPMLAQMFFVSQTHFEVLIWKNITCSSFFVGLVSVQECSEVVAVHCQRALEVLQEQGSVAQRWQGSHADQGCQEAAAAFSELEF